MDQIMKHFGSAILAAVVLLALGGIIITLANGTVQTQFNNLLANFFSDMNALRSVTPTP